MSIKTIITTSLPVIATIAFALENLDTNDTGIDDKLAKQVQAVAAGLKEYLNTLPPDEPKVIQGYQATKTFCENVLASIDFVIASSIDRETKESRITELVKSLWDRTIVYQAIRGNDAKILDITKKDAQNKQRVFLGIKL
jgi:hypothetical protein